MLFFGDAVVGNVGDSVTRAATQHDNQLINAIRVEEKAYVVRFCDLAPRNIADIYADVKTTTVRHRHITTTPKPYAKFEKVSKSSAELVPLSPRPSTSAPVTTLPITAAPTTAPPLPTTLRIALPAVVSPDPTTEAPTTPPPPRPIAPDDDFTSGNSVMDAEEATVPTAAPTMGPTSTPQAVKPHKAKTVKLRTTTSAPTTPTTGSPLVVEEQIDDITADEKQNIEEDEGVDIPLTASPTPIEDIIRKIQSASSKSAEKMFKETIANLLKEEKSTDAPTVEKVSDLSRLTFRNEDFPKSNEKKFAIPAKMKVSKTNLPLKVGASSDDFVFLRPINSEGTRRAPIRTHRPHVVSISVLND
ncbi:unnamed protein product [Heligmosomoides polygyrus]|uniref:DUF4758 domain-containing protein n=1 Tax=Heligmosomoides polygyrus TaxID=6339 RepID=A0A183GGF7_HELPZ|nr:unnamed protein product [Heligmosomoides polygyrus]